MKLDVAQKGLLHLLVLNVEGERCSLHAQHNTTQVHEFQSEKGKLFA